jgi:hypothetical protein
MLINSINNYLTVCAGSSYGHITDFEHTHPQFEVGQADANMSTSTTTEPKTAKPVSTDNVPDPGMSNNTERKILL